MRHFKKWKRYYLTPVDIDSNRIELSCAGSKCKVYKAEAMSSDNRPMFMGTLKQVKIPMETQTSRQETTVGV